MGFLSKLVKLNGGIIIGGATLTAYSYPELTKNPAQLFHSMVRGVRFGVTGGLVAADYYRAEAITPEVHEKASLRMYKCFRKNGGPYIKIGQILGQLDQLVPDEYIKAFEPMLMAAPKTSYEDVRSIFEDELGKTIEQVFSSFDE